METYCPYSQGDIKIEANLEYRFKIWWILHGAAFIDAGNVWALTGYEDNGGNFSSQFMKQMAVAAGWGMRWDFTYFNIRFDFGYRMRDPYPTQSKYWYSLKRVREQKLGNIQVAVNYPFNSYSYTKTSRSLVQSFVFLLLMMSFDQMECTSKPMVLNFSIIRYWVSKSLKFSSLIIPLNKIVVAFAGSPTNFQ